MKVLFVHQNFPAQFGRLASWMGRQPGHQAVFLTRRKEVEFTGVQKVLFKEARAASEKIHPYVRPIEEVVLQGQAAYRSATALKQKGFIPDVIYGHSGFGATVYLKNVFPKVPFVGYFEWYYHARGTDVDFDPGQPVSEDDDCRIRTRNLMILPDLVECSAGVTPTYWQHMQFPVDFLPKLRVIHDGIDARYFSPAPGTKLQLQHCKLDLSDQAEIVTYVGRGFEPYRGFPQFMEAMSILMKRRKKCHVVIAGTDTTVYGPKHPSGKTYKELMLSQFDYDLERLHFTGLLPYGDYQKLLQASSVHVYLTRPFVLSWSMIESLSCGCCLVASDTPPVREVVKDGENGLLVDFFSPQQMADQIERALDDGELRKKMGENARQTALERYDMEKLLPQHFKLLAHAASGR